MRFDWRAWLSWAGRGMGVAQDQSPWKVHVERAQALKSPPELSFFVSLRC